MKIWLLNLVYWILCTIMSFNDVALVAKCFCRYCKYVVSDWILAEFGRD